MLSLCHKVDEHENMVWVCDCAANVRQIGHGVGVLIINLDKARMCCMTAVVAGSKPHLEIAEQGGKAVVVVRAERSARRPQKLKRPATPLLPERAGGQVAFCPS